MRSGLRIVAGLTALLALAAGPLEAAPPKARRPRGRRKQRIRAPRPPRDVEAYRVAPGVIGVAWNTRRAQKGPKGYLVFRADAAKGPYRRIAERPAERPYCLDTKVEPDTVYYYKVAAFSDLATPSAQAGPACAWDNDQLLPNGSFELDPPGLLPAPTPALGWARRSRNARTPVAFIPGGPDGKQCAEIRSRNDCVHGGFHSYFFPMVEGETWLLEGWTRALPGAHPRVYYYFCGEDRRGVKVKGLKKSYDFCMSAAPREDGWTHHEKRFTAPKTTRYLQVWFFGHQARNTFWLDGARLVDLTAKAMRKLDIEPQRRDAPKVCRSPGVPPEFAARLERLTEETGRLAARMKNETDTLSPRDYRGLYIERHRAEKAFLETYWTAKTLAVMGQ